MGPIQLAGDRLIYDAIHHNKTELSDPGITRNKIIKDIDSSLHAIRAMDARDPKKLIISFVNEGHALEEAKLLLTHIKSWFQDYQISFVFSTVNTDTCEFAYKCMPTSMIDHRHWFSNLLSEPVQWHKIILDKKFLCLNRRPSRVRERLVFRLLQTLKPHSLRVSLGCLDSQYFGPKIWLSENIFVDGVVSDRDKCQAQDPRFYSCLFNIITESSDQSDPNVWKSMFITEKTWKPFAMRQIPLWMGLPGMVKIIRDLGFDVFDDICQGHTYDQQQDEDIRQEHLIDLVTYIDSRYSIICCRKLRREISSRLENNYNRLLQLNQQQSGLYMQIINGM